MRVLLDTNTVSHLARRLPTALARLGAEQPDAIAVSTITVHEVEYGLRVNPGAERRVGAVMRDLLGAVRHLPFDDVCAHRAADLRAIAKRAGRPIGAYDLLIVATALEHGLVLATSNVRELGTVAGLVLEDWAT